MLTLEESSPQWEKESPEIPVTAFLSSEISGTNLDFGAQKSIAHLFYSKVWLLGRVFDSLVSEISQISDENKAVTSISGDSFSQGSAAIVKMR